MAENTPQIKQLKSLSRLRQLQRDKSAKQLASANRDLKQANEDMLTAEARYQLILEMQRKIRQAGRAINPLFYSHQFEAADIAKFQMDKTETKWQEAKINKARMLSSFTIDHSQLTVAQNAVDQALKEYYKLQEKREMEDGNDQQSKTIQINQQ